MTALDRTLKCHVCGAPYKFYAFSAADQSACPACVAEAERRVRAPTESEKARYDRRRSRHWE